MNAARGKILYVMALFLLGSCRGHLPVREVPAADSAQSERQEGTLSPPGCTAPAKSPVPLPPMVQTSIRVDLEVPARVLEGEPVPFTLRVRNVGEEPAVLEYGGGPGGPLLVVQVSRPDGGAIWNSLRYLRPAGRSRRFAPGEELMFQVTWHQRDDSRCRVPPGSYRAQASVAGEPAGPRSAPKPFEIVP